MKKLVSVLFIIVALPVFGAVSIHSRHEAQAFNSVAVAGRSVAGGGWCACGCADCICDPDEVPVACGERATVAPDEGAKGSSDAGLMLALFVLALAVRFGWRVTS